MGLDADALAALVKLYFEGVDKENLDQIFKTLTPDCKFTVETHGVVLNGHEEIRGMFQNLWSSHAAVKHDQFTYVCDPGASRVAAQFRVVNTLPSGEFVYTSNCNFFHVGPSGLFDAVAVYMAGENTLEGGAKKAKL